MSAASDEPSLYERLGGRERIEQLVKGFYDRILADPQLAPFFEGASMDNLHRMQTEFFAAALGGPQQYSGRNLAAVHHGRGITRLHFSAFCQHVFAQMEEMGVSPDDMNSAVARIALTARDITGEPNVDG